MNGETYRSSFARLRRSFGVRRTARRTTNAERRTTTFGLLAGALACALLLSAHATAQSGASWPQFRGNPRLTGMAESVPPAAPKLLWKFEVGESIDSSAAIVDGVVYVGAFNGDLVAVDFATGKLRWKYEAGSPIGESSPAVSGGTVFVGDSSGIFHAVRTRRRQQAVDVQDRRARSSRRRWSSAQSS